MSRSHRTRTRTRPQPESVDRHTANPAPPPNAGSTPGAPKKPVPTTKSSGSSPKPATAKKPPTAPKPAAAGTTAVANELAAYPGIALGPNANAAVVSALTLSIVDGLMKSAQVTNLTITSTARTAADQARAMYQNLVVPNGVQTQLGVYGPVGDKVVLLYDKLAKEGRKEAEILQQMTNLINTLGPGKVSAHCADPSKLNVLDIDPNSIAASKRKAFETAVNAAIEKKSISKFIGPHQGDPAYHIEIPQTN